MGKGCFWGMEVFFNLKVYQNAILYANNINKAAINKKRMN